MVYFHIENDMLSDICRSETLQQVNGLSTVLKTQKMFQDHGQQCPTTIVMCSCVSGLLKVHYAALYDVASIEVNRKESRSSSPLPPMFT